MFEANITHQRRQNKRALKRLEALYCDKRKTKRVFFIDDTGTLIKRRHKYKTRLPLIVTERCFIEMECALNFISRNQAVARWMKTLHYANNQLFMLNCCLNVSFASSSKDEKNPSL
ncbi:Hypothetical protein CINCED_3A021692 [Cinara cedri]|uniref:Uncharacterized protein n=1 Tax=Cinara cedri TaxID=506608 RepID=A0A5E4NAE9_9HEMI|nr:Hypothetical protein CINCED_3A021692 [Cinara cedri]